MSLLKNISKVIRQEIKNYLLDQEERGLKRQQNQALPAKEAGDRPQSSENAAIPHEIKEGKRPQKKKRIVPLINAEFVKFSYKEKIEDVVIPRDLADIIKMLPSAEFACFVKIFCLVQEQRKNYGYLGGSLKRRSGLDSLSSAEFDELTKNLKEYGLLDIEQITDNQRTFTLYIPFDEEIMTKAEIKQNRQPKKENLDKPNLTKDELPGRAVEGMENDEMYKSYRTFVNLEIDKAKMRVGRSNFDKIYMEAVKYIDKKYGFKVLSDSDKFKEYLTNYYISAFDIPAFETWKKEHL